MKKYILIFSLITLVLLLMYTNFKNDCINNTTLRDDVILMGVEICDSDSINFHNMGDSDITLNLYDNTYFQKEQIIPNDTIIIKPSEVYKTNNKIDDYIEVLFDDSTNTKLKIY